MGTERNSSGEKSRALDAFDYKKTRERLRSSNPMARMLIALLIISAMFRGQQLLSEPLDDKPASSTKESPADTLSMQNLPGPDDPVAVDRAPELITAVPPKYPLDALKEYKTGVVWIKVLVDTRGVVRNAIIEKESGENVGFEKAALDAATQRRYRPALYKDKPVAAWISYEVSFQLKLK